MKKEIENRSEQFIVRVTKSEKEKIQKIAQSKGMNVSTYLRAKMLGVI